MINKELFHKALIKTMHIMYGDNVHNCYAYHSLASKALTKLNINHELQIGYAIWRINGESPSGVVCHLPNCKIEISPQNVNSLQYHAWLKVDNNIVDFTTYQLKHKSAMLDNVDGNQNEVEWCPDYLWEDESKMNTFDEARNGYNAGLYNYDYNLDIYNIVVNSFAGVLDNDVQLLLNNYKVIIDESKN